MPYNTGISATLVFSGAISFTARWRSIGSFRRFREMLEDTALSSQGYRESVPDDLNQSDPLDVEIYWDGTKDPPLGTVGTITLTFPLQEGQSTPAIVSGTGCFNSAELPELAAGERLIQPAQLTFDGKTGPTYTAAT